MDWVTLLWQGEVPLRQTYWIYGVGVFFILTVVQSTPTLHSQFVFVFIRFIYAPFIIVAVWRSASNYKGSVWLAGLAKFTVIAVATHLAILTIQAVVGRLSQFLYF